MLVTDNAPIPLIMTRPRAQSERFVGDLPRFVRGVVQPIFSPLIEIAPLDAPVLVAADEAVIFTSANGVACAPDGKGQRAFCVGAATTASAQARGWDAVQCGETSQALISALKSSPPQQRLWHLAGVHTRGGVAEKLGASGLTVTHVPLYDQALLPLTDAAQQALNRERNVIVPLFSPRTARQYVSSVLDTSTAHVIVISEAVAAEVAEIAPKSLGVAGAPTAEKMTEMIEKLARALVMG